MKIRMVCNIGALTLLMLMTSLASAQSITRCGGATTALYINWPMFHFDVCRTGNNPYEHTISPSTVSGLAKAWMYQAGPDVASSPALVNGVIYVGSQDGNVYALNATTGALIWTYQTGGAEMSSPAVANGVVYVGSTADNFFALNASTGALLWSYSVTDNNGVPSSPVVSDGIVSFTSLYHVYALNAATGALMWQQKANGAIAGDGNASPAVVNGVLYVGENDGMFRDSGTVYALNARTGAIIWSHLLGNQTVLYGSPAVINGVVYVAGSTDNAPMEAGFVYALDALSGAVLWSYNLPAVDLIHTSPAVANGVVYVVSSNYLWALDAHTGALAWKMQPFYPAASSPTVANGVVYTGSIALGRCECIAYLQASDASTGAVLWFYQTANVVDANQSSAIVANGTMYVGSGNGGVYAFRLANQ